MRLAAQAKGGFYAVPPEALQVIACHMRAPQQQPIALLDPCAGQGAAIKQWAEHLGCPLPQVHAIELDEGRAQLCKENLPGAQVLGPCSFLGTGISASSFSFVWCNPPYDDEIGGGGRVEETFLFRSLQVLKAGGIIALACPEHVSERYQLRDLFLTWCQDICVVPYPERHRAFSEVVVFGKKLAKPRQAHDARWAEVCSETPLTYELPSGTGPRRFDKTELTTEEKARALAKSPLRRLLEPPAELGLPEPGLPLSTGQLALVLASGHLNGVVAKPGEQAHVIRGVASKENYLASVEEQEDAKGKPRTVSTYSQRICLTVRALAADGSLKDFA